MGVNRTEYSDEVVFEGADGTLCCIDSMFFRRHSLEVDFAFGKGVFEILGAFVI